MSLEILTRGLALRFAANLRRSGALFGLLALALAGCLQAETTVTVGRDGSGTIVDRLLMSNEMITLMTELMPEGETFQLFNEDELREDVSKYGDAVRFESAQELTTEFGKGFEARYAFDDVAGLRIAPDVGEKIPGEEEAAAEETGEEPVTFALDRGDPAELVIRWPVSRATAEGGEPPAEPGETPAPDAESIEMMRSMMQGLSLAMHVEVMGEILESNATHRSGPRVTLLQLSFAELLANDAAFTTVMQQEPQSLADLKRLMQDIPGMKLEIEPEVTIRFR